MANLWPWLAVAGLGALHGLNPAAGWAWAAAWGVRSRSRARVLQALVPIAMGHLASVALVGTAVVWGLSLDRVVLQVLAGGLLVMGAWAHLAGHTPKAVRAPAGHAGLALWSFIIATAHGAGLMLVPALIPLCMGDASPAREGGAADALAPAMAAVGLHMAAMLAVTGIVATGVCRGFEAGRGAVSGRRVWAPCGSRPPHQAPAPAARTRWPAGP